MAFKRKMTATIAGKQITLAATFGAAESISENVADPLVIANEYDKASRFLEMGLPYQPRFHFTVKNVAQIVHIGAKAAGENMDLDQVQELVFEHGIADATTFAADYLMLLIGPAPEKKIEPTGEPDLGK